MGRRARARLHGILGPTLHRADRNARSRAGPAEGWPALCALWQRCLYLRGLRTLPADGRSRPGSIQNICEFSQCWKRPYGPTLRPPIRTCVVAWISQSLPVNLLRKIFRNQIVVVGLQFFQIGLGVALGVEVVRVEL